jgi:hypothetical protein
MGHEELKDRENLQEEAEEQGARGSRGFDVRLNLRSPNSNRKSLLPYFVTPSASSH